MEREPRGEHTPSSPEQSEVGNDVDRLPELLGFVETEELSRLRRELTVAITQESAAARELTARYLSLGERVVNEYQGESFAKAQIGLSIMVSLIRRDAGRLDDYAQDLEEAYEYADNMGFDDITDALDAELARLSRQN